MLKKLIGNLYVKAIGFAHQRFAAIAAALAFCALTFVNHIQVVVDGIIDITRTIGITQAPLGIVDDAIIAIIAWFVYMYFTQIRPPKARIMLTPEDVEKSIQTGCVEVVLQPVYHIRTNMVSGFESLVRLHHPTYGVVLPCEFLDGVLFERSTVAYQLTQLVIEKTAEYYSEFARDGHDFQMTVNLFASDLQQSDVQQLIKRTMTSYDMPNDRMTVEISEHVIAQNAPEYMKVITSLGNSGVKISLDDYGVQVTSFIRVKESGAAGVKLDQRLIGQLETSAANKELIQTIIHGAHSLGTSVTAKHVETQQVKDILRDLDCDYVQGYIVAPPMPFEQTREWIKTRKSRRIIKD